MSTKLIMDVEFAARRSVVEARMSEEQLVFAYHNGTLFSFERAYQHSASEFGGPLEVKLSGIEHGPKPLHFIAQLAAADLRLTPPRAPERGKLFTVPLIYGMCFDGCNIEYHVDVKGNIEIREMRPTESSDDWPYRNYPLLLPYFPLQIGETRNCSYAEFAQAFVNMPELQPADLVVAVPTPVTLGISLWGRWTSAVTIVFECDLSDRVVSTYNVCD